MFVGFCPTTPSAATIFNDIYSTDSGSSSNDVSRPSPAAMLTCFPKSVGHQIDRQEHRVRYKSVCRSLGICQSVHKDNQACPEELDLEDHRPGRRLHGCSKRDIEELDHFLLRSTTGHKERKDEKGNKLFHKSKQ